MRLDKNPDWLYSEDLIRDGEYTSPTVTIESVIEPNTLRAADGKPVDKWALTFVGAKRALILAKTNVRMLPYVTGSAEPKDWPGKRIRLQVRIVKAFGEEVPAIRIVPESGVKIRRGLADRLGKRAKLGIKTASAPTGAHVDESKTRQAADEFDAALGPAADDFETS